MLVIDRLQPDQLAAIKALLAEHALPIDDLDDPAITLFGAVDDGRLVGAIGIQRCDDAVLLRSLVVRGDARRGGAGRQLVDRVVAEAGGTPVFLLTTDASGYFERLGFLVVERDRVPAAIRATRQFSSLCPSSAIVMRAPR